MSRDPASSRLDLLVQLVKTLDAAATWGEPPFIIRLDSLPPSADDSIVFAVRSLGPGEHPLDFLSAYVAPADCQGLGVVAEGWAYDLEHYAARKRKGRARAVHLVGRDGSAAGGWRLQGQGLATWSGGDQAVGAIPAALRACLGLDDSTMNRRPA